MALTLLTGFRNRHRTVALDTSVFIYQLQESPTYYEFTSIIFRSIAAPRYQAVTSTITLTEVMVVPHRDGGPAYASRAFTLLTAIAGVRWLPPDLEIANTAAKLRAEYRLKTPDALQAATAIHGGVTALITNDPIFERVPTFETLLLDKLVH